jgi:hypothetical protein
MTKKLEIKNIIRSGILMITIILLYNNYIDAGIKNHYWLSVMAFFFGMLTCEMIEEKDGQKRKKS